MKYIIAVTQTACILMCLVGCVLVDGCDEEVIGEKTNFFDIYEESDSTWAIVIDLGLNDGVGHEVVLNGEEYEVSNNSLTRIEIDQTEELELIFTSTIHSFRDTVHLPLSPMFSEMSINGMPLLDDDTTTIAEADSYLVSWKPLLHSSIREKITVSTNLESSRGYSLGLWLEDVTGEEFFFGDFKDLLVAPGDRREVVVQKEELEGCFKFRPQFSFGRTVRTGNYNNRFINYSLTCHYFLKINN